MVNFQREECLSTDTVSLVLPALDKVELVAVSLVLGLQTCGTMPAPSAFKAGI